MATEQLNSSTVIVNSDIPQTLEEKLLQTSTIVNKDIPQTVEEKMLQTTVVVGQIGDNQRAYIYENNASSVNLTNGTNLFIDFTGKQRVIVMINIVDSQLAV